MAQQEQSRLRPTGRRLLWAAGIVIGVLVLIRVLYALPWTGFGQYEVNEGVQRYKTLWDWLKLLVVPLVLAIGGYWFTREERKATDAVAERRAEEDALQAYLEQLSHLLLDKAKPLRESNSNNEARILARARTLTVLARLTGHRKAHVVRFLYESDLIHRDHPAVSLKGADLSGANLSDASLTGANLKKANLKKANLEWADLRGACLTGADLSWANLDHARLDADEHKNKTNLGAADLSWASLRRAALEGADLTWAFLVGADLKGAWGYSEEQLCQARTLSDAIMPWGETYEKWQKRKGSGEDGEGSGAE